MQTLSLGKHNPKLAEIRKAIRAETLTRDGLLVIEGPILLGEAEKSGLEIVDVFIEQRGLKNRTDHPGPSGHPSFLRRGNSPPETGGVAAREAQARQGAASREDRPGGRSAGGGPLTISPHSVELPSHVFKSIQATEHSQGVIATVRPRHFTLNDVVNPAPALIVVLGRLQDPGNVGTMLRIAESFGATGCIALRGTASFYNSKTVRASAGSLFRLPHVGSVELSQAIQTLKSKKIGIAGTAPLAKMTIDEWDWRKPAALVIGNEGSGLSAEELEHCDAVLRIPHSEVVESLNSAIAAAVAMYEASKQRSMR